jgi:hypothetical protein
MADPPNDAATISGGEIVELFENLAPVMQEELLTRALRKDPTVLPKLLFPEVDDPAMRLDGTLDVQRELHKQAVKDAVRLIRASKAKPVYPRELRYTAEQLRDGTLQAPTPTVGGLLYPGRVSALYGSHTAGKTWTALHIASLEAAQGGKVLLLDYEDSVEGVAARCIAIGGGLEESVMYHAPEGVITASALAHTVEAKGITLVIIDSVGESMAASGYDSNSELDVTAWFTEVPDGIASLGPAVLVLDHIAKRQDGTPQPVGSFRKSAAITGAQFALENKVGFSKTLSGWSKLTCTKDRNGYFATGEVVGRIDFEPDDGTMRVRFTRGEMAETLVDGRFTRLEQAILDFVAERYETVHGKLDDAGDEMDGRPNITQIREAVKTSGVPGHNTKIRESVDDLVTRGWLVLEHIKSGKTTRDVYVPGDGGFERHGDGSDDTP